MAGPTFASVDDYLAAQPAPARSVLARVRATIKKALPRATEGISYQIPIFKLDGTMVLYFAGFQSHYSIYPATPRLLGALRKELAGSLHNKATIRFSFDEPVPTRLITQIAKVRAAEVIEKKAAKDASKSAKKKSSKKKAAPAARSKSGRKKRA